MSVSEVIKLRALDYRCPECLMPQNHSCVRDGKASSEPHPSRTHIVEARDYDARRPAFAGQVDGLPAYPRPFTYGHGKAYDANGVEVPAWLLDNLEEDARCNTL